MKQNWADLYGNAAAIDGSGSGQSYADSVAAPAIPDYAPAPDPTGGLYGTTTTTLTGTIGSTTEQMALYLTEAGNTSAVAVSDINQGQIGDCYLLSSIGEIVLTDPSFITNMITQNSNGTETVKLYAFETVKVGHSSITELVATTKTVTNNFASYSVDNGASQDVVGGVKEIWPQVLENAFAQLGGGYSSIMNGGSPVYAMEELTGNAATWYSPTQFGSTAAQVTANFNTLIKANDMIVLDTSMSGNSTYNLVGDHAYMFDGLVTQGGATYVKALNPWGFDQPSLIPVTALSKAFVEVDVGKA